jgi:uncharacterized membrane protein
MSTMAALAIYTSVGTGMLSLTGIVFSLVFVMVQFSAIAYSPRLALWIARNRVIWHVLGVFTATFIYSWQRSHGWIAILLGQCCFSAARS